MFYCFDQQVGVSVQGYRQIGLLVLHTHHNHHSYKYHAQGAP